MLAVPQAVAEVGCVEDVFHPLNDLSSCGKFLLHRDVLVVTLSGLQYDTAFGPQVWGRSKAKNPMDSTKGNFDEVAVVFNWCSNPLVTKGDGGTYFKAW